MIRAIADSAWAADLTKSAMQSAVEQFHGDPAELRFWTGLQEEDGSGWATMRFGDPPPAAATPP
jgi:hypothetical protein